jgi:hypothetical protein
VSHSQGLSKCVQVSYLPALNIGHGMVFSGSAGCSLGDTEVTPSIRIVSSSNPSPILYTKFP